MFAKRSVSDTAAAPPPVAAEGVAAAASAPPLSIRVSEGENAGEAGVRLGVAAEAKRSAAK